MPQLTLADEIVVLMLDDAEGEIRPDCLPLAAVAIVGGVLMELALRGRVDSDLQALFVVDDTPTGDTLLDAFLAELQAEDGRFLSAWWIDRLAKRHADIVDGMLERLVAAGILRVQETRHLWVFSRRAYPPVSGQEEREAKARLMAVLFAAEMPDPRDTLLLGLANASGALAAILSEEEWEAATGRIAEVGMLEEIGRAVRLVARHEWNTIAAIMGGHPV